MPVSDGRELDAVDDLLGQRGRPQRRTGILVVHNAVRDADRLRQGAVIGAEHRVVSPLPAAHAAIADRVAEGHQHLIVPGIAVVPHDSEVGASDREPLDGVVGALSVRSPSRRATFPAAGRAQGGAGGWRRWRRGLSDGRCVRNRRRSGRRRHSRLLLHPSRLRHERVQDRPRQPAQVGQRRAVVGLAGPVADRRAADARQLRSRRGVRRRGRLGLRSSSCTRLRGSGRCDDDPEDEPDSGRRRHRYRCDSSKRRHVTPFKGQYVAVDVPLWLM